MSRILIIDDSDLIRDMLKASLSHEGFTVELASDANEGYSAAIEFGPDLILLDVQLPDVVGFDLIRIIKNREDLRHIPIIMITGTAHSTEEKVKGFQLGADDYVMKPFEMPELLERIKALLRRAAMRPTEFMEPEPIPAPVKPAPTTTRLGGPTPAHAPARTSAPVPVSVPPKSEWSMRRVMQVLITSPRDLPRLEHYPPVGMLYLALALSMGYAGLAFAAGPVVKPALMTVAILGIWGILVSLLIMSTSVLGIHIAWKDGARIFSLAGIPLLFKLASAVLVSAWTTLSPFYFQAGPALFFSDPSFWLQRMDVFEIWSALLLWALVRVQSGSNGRKTTGVVACVWLAGALLALAVQNVGAGN